MTTQLRYARSSDDVTIAYTVDGQAARTLIWLPPVPFSNIVAQYQVPLLRDVYARLTSSVRLVLIDGRGTGHSQREVSDLGLEAMLRDLDAVVADARLTSFALFGYYHSVTHALAYAARHPSRVTHLVLFGGTARGFDAMSPAETQALLSLIERDWDLFVESAAHAWMGWGAGEDGRLMAEAFRTATTPTVARATMQAAAEIDVSAEVPHITAPALILQIRGDRLLPNSATEALAHALPNGRIGRLAGTAASLFSDQADTDLSLILDFLTDGTTGPARPQTPPDAAGLTSRELDVLRLVAGGETNAAIAHRLGLSVHSVERHAANLYRKIGARGRADAATYAVRRGLV
jgi:DNA-binding NarL/FixJ family response regulator